MLVLREAFLGTRRFNDFERELGIARNILSTRLKMLVEAGILQRVQSTQDKRVFEYVLTDAGKALHPALIALSQWAQTWLGGDCCAVQFVDRDSGQPLPEMQIRNQDGELLGLKDIGMIPGPDADDDVKDRYARAVAAAG